MNQNEEKWLKKRVSVKKISSALLNHPKLAIAGVSPFCKKNGLYIFIKIR